jgi:hypothetical protein
VSSRITCWALKTKMGNLVNKSNAEFHEPQRNLLFRTKKLAVAHIMGMPNFFATVKPVKVIVVTKELE